MLTKDDKSWVTGNFVTRGEFRERMDELSKTYARTEKKLDKVLTIVEGFAGKVAELDQENKFGSVILQRHGVQIRELATATGTTLSE